MMLISLKKHTMKFNFRVRGETWKRSYIKTFFLDLDIKTVNKKF